MLSSLRDSEKVTVRSERIAAAVVKLDAWLQTMRSPVGFTGPIAHWWESCLVYCGPMIDWRYEGIIAGYVTLFESTADSVWLERAKQAAEYVLAAQLPSGNFRNSSFQHGAMEGGTPHEAAVDVGLLELARLLRRLGDSGWSRYLHAAERNLRGYWIGALWNSRGFQEQPWDSTLVANKNATALEALLLYQELSGHDMQPYIEAALSVILTSQERSGPRSGGTVHRGTGKYRLTIGIYTARSMCALLGLYRQDARPELLDAVAEAMIFLNRLITSRGTTFGYYLDGSPVTNPRWIAPSGDLLRAAILAQEYGVTPPGMIDELVDLLLDHQLRSGGIPTACGFDHLGSRRLHSGSQEFRDVLPVVGWCDKALRALSLLFPSQAKLVPADIGQSQVACVWKGRLYTLCENEVELRLVSESGADKYRWRKGEVWPEVYEL